MTKTEATTNPMENDMDTKVMTNGLLRAELRKLIDRAAKSELPETYVLDALEEAKAEVASSADMAGSA